MYRNTLANKSAIEQTIASSLIHKLILVNASYYLPLSLVGCADFADVHFDFRVPFVSFPQSLFFISNNRSQEFFAKILGDKKLR